MLALLDFCKVGWNVLVFWWGWPRTLASSVLAGSSPWDSSKQVSAEAEIFSLHSRTAVLLILFTPLGILSICISSDPQLLWQWDFSQLPQEDFICSSFLIISLVFPRARNDCFCSTSGLRNVPAGPPIFHPCQQGVLLFSTVYTVLIWFWGKDCRWDWIYNFRVRFSGAGLILVLGHGGGFFLFSSASRLILLCSAWQEFVYLYISAYFEISAWGWGRELAGNLGVFNHRSPRGSF